MLSTPDFDFARDRLAKVFSYLQSTQQSDFYRKRFANLHLADTFPDSFEVWRTLPILEREEIVSVPFWDRTFVPKKDVMFYRHTSGTSGRKPLITPRKAFGDYAAALRLVGAKRQISFLYGWYVTEEPRRSAGVISMNCFFPESAEDFRYVAALAKHFKPDALLGYPSLFLLLVPYLKSVGALDHIRILELTGERCSEAQYAALKRLYNNPQIFNQFGSTEAAGVYGGPCTKILANASLGFHIVEDHFLTEFIDPDTLKPADPRESPCETLLTSLTTDQPLPFIRYRTGDLMRAEKHACDCERGGYVFFSEGRAHSDRVHFLDGVIAIKRLEEVLALYAEMIDPDYEAHYFEEDCDDGVVRARVEVRVIPNDRTLDLDRLADEISDRFMLSAILSYKKAVEDGLLLPLRVSVLTRKAQISPKPKRLFRHAQ